MHDEEHTIARYFSFARKGLFWCCFGSMFFYMLGTWLIRESIAPVYALIPDIPGNISTLVSIAVAAFIIIASYLKPRLLNPKIGLGLAVVLIGVGLVLVYMGATTVDTTALISGLVLNCIGKSYGTYTMGLALCRLGHTRDTAIAISAGIVCSSFVRAILPHVSETVGYLCFAIVPLAILVCSWYLAAPMLKRISVAPPLRQLRMTNPSAFIGPFNRLFLCIVVFSVARGFSGTFDGLAANELLSFSCIGALLVALWAIFGSEASREDALFSASGFIVIAGFLLAPVSAITSGGVTSSILTCGSMCFSILMWMSLAAVAERNLVAAPSVFAVGIIGLSGGTMVGSLIGRWSLDVSGSTGDIFHLMIALLVFGFIIFLWVGMRDFSFAETIRGIHRVQAIEPIADQGERFDGACRDLAEGFGLTPREAEVFTLLARGRNGQFIQDSLVISRNTAKTHIKHIYQKAGVHSQQDLIDAVEARLDA